MGINAVVAAWRGVVILLLGEGRMTREELILMAAASGVSFYGMGKDRERFMDRLQRFAGMILSAQPSQKPDSAKVKLFNDRMALSEEALTAMKIMAAAEEREACAKVCDDHWNKSIDCGDKAGALQCVGIRTAIRARGQA